MGALLNPYIFAVGGVSNVTDDFNRADSTTSLGTASDGVHAWTAQLGTWGINSNQGYCPTLSGGGGRATVNYGARDCTLQFTTKVAASNWGATLAYESATDNIRVRYETAFTRIKLTLNRNGFASVDLINVPGAWANNDVLKVVLTGNSATVFKNGSSIGTITDARLADATGTEHGLYTESTASRFEDLSITP